MPTEKRKQGFAVLPPDKHREVSSRGGKSIGKPKGYATLSPEERKQNASNASKARWERVRAERIESANSPRVDNPSQA